MSHLRWIAIFLTGWLAMGIVALLGWPWISRRMIVTRQGTGQN